VYADSLASGGTHFGRELVAAELEQALRFTPATQIWETDLAA
jgi:hypothetical protein